MDSDKYERQGVRAFNANYSSESCRYKDPKIRSAWQRGYDRAAQAHARREAESKRVRWESYGDNRWANPPRAASEYYLRGDAPHIIVHGQSYTPGAWFVSCHKWGIDSERLEAVDPEDAKREAIVVVTRMARERVAKLEAIATIDGGLRSAADESEAES